MRENTDAWINLVAICRCDLNGDGIVNPGDLGLLLVGLNYLAAYGQINGISGWYLWDPVTGDFARNENGVYYGPYRDENGVLLDLGVYDLNLDRRIDGGDLGKLLNNFTPDVQTGCLDL